MDITIFIRARNEEQYIGRCLEMIFRQETQRTFEVIVLDSGSEDRTIAETLRFQTQIYQIPAALFSYAAALNFGRAKASGELLVFLSAHAIPLNEEWLEQLVAPLLADSTVAASYSRQIPWPDCCAEQRMGLEVDFPTVLSVIDRLAFEQAIASGADWYGQTKFSNVSSCVWRRYAAAFPFRVLPFSEDRALAIDLLAAGLKYAYAAKSVVYHSHKPNLLDFYGVAKKATMARFGLEMIGLKQGLLKRGNSPVKVALLASVRLPLALLYCLLRAGLCAVRGFSVEQAGRSARFFVASVGTSFGKLVGALHVLQNGVSFPEPADELMLVSVARLVEAEPA